MPVEARPDAVKNGGASMHERLKGPAIALSAMALMVATGLAVASPAFASSGRAGTKASPSRAQMIAVAKQFLSHVGSHDTMHRVGTYSEKVSNGITSITSGNWSGYADYSSTKNAFSAVSGDWTEPTATCTGSGLSLAAFWVGIDGISNADPTVQQDGTIIECEGTSALYADWWETYPGNAVQIENVIDPGDHIAASVKYASNGYTMAVTDSTHSGASFSVTEPCGASTCENESAEWIAEAPCCKSANHVYNLSDFTKWKLTSAATTYEGTSGPITIAPTGDEITMVDSSDRDMAVPGALKSGNTAFKVKWERTN
jgi:hypothetical protein